ncbi:hypothetical protein PybrP1_001562 [[Pythium] brassicae (nom. inval.)]|nr:hypothetical protein PybrP1_001562 [[Pythium] brassicae (nom. inval.)]
MGIGTRAKKWLGRLRGNSQQEEAQQLRPVALAGASRKSSGRPSTLCSSFAATVSTEELERSFRRSHKALSDGALLPPPGWKQCLSCARNFQAPASSFKDFCSLDCKSLSFYRTSSLS